MISTLRRRPWVAAALLLVSSSAFAAKRKLELSDLTAEPEIVERGVTGLAWLPDGRSFSYVLQKGSGEDALSELWIEEAATGKKKLVVARSTLAVPQEPKGTEVAPGVAKQPAKTRTISLAGYQWSPDGRSVLLSGESDLWLYHPDTRKLERLTQDPEEEDLATFAPDGKRVAFVRKNDLWFIDVASRKQTRLTTDGSDVVWNGKLDWVYEEELASRSSRAFQWSPDGSQIAYLRLDDGPIDPYPITDFLPTPARVQWQRYPKAGARNPIPSFRVVGVDGTLRGRIDFDGESYVAPSFSWTLDSKSVCYRVLNRAQTRQDVRLWTPTAGGNSRSLWVEQDRFWINDDGAEAPRFLSDGRFLWKSERSGFAHLYVGSVAGGPVTAITHGDWMVDRVAGVDQKKGLVFFTATEENVRRRPIYRVGLDGKGFTRLTQTAGTHGPELSPDGRYLLDTFSTLSQPPALSLLDASGKTVRVVHRPTNRLADFELATTDEIRFPAGDGVPLEARLTKPADFDPSRKYPVIVSVYGGPHAQVVHDAWGATGLFDHLLASRGFLVWSVDNRGSWARGHAWESAIFEETGKHELADQLAGVGYLKKLSYVDPARIGIFGWSYGGYMTLYALTNAPDVWKCGVAGAPVTHWKFYDSIYTERYMRTPRDNPKGYEASAPLTKAGNLKAKLLLIHGTSDDNVHMQNTVAFIDALVKAGKQYELKIAPGQKHGFRGKAALDFRNAAIVEFFEKNL